MKFKIVALIAVAVITLGKIFNINTTDLISTINNLLEQIGMLFIK